MPFVPICYRSGTVAYSRFITGDVTATVHDIYLNIEQWGYDDADTLGSSQSSDNDD